MTEDVVRAAIKRYQGLFEASDVEGIVREFTDDAVIRYGPFAQFSGKDKLRTLLQQRFAAMREYRLSKRLEFISPPRIAASWTGSWVDSSGTRMESFGVEVLTMRDGKIAEWLASVSTWHAGGRTRP
jgi:nuclear transport factor 2 (NTF2) superfamily protein